MFKTMSMSMANISAMFNISTSSNPVISLALLSFSILFLLIAVLLYAFQSKLIYMPQLPPGSREQVWLPSEFGYGPGRTLKKNPKDHDSDDERDERDSEDKWEEVQIVTRDKVKLQAYWIKAPSKWTKQSTETEPYTILYMQANAGNIVPIKMFLFYVLEL